MSIYSPPYALVQVSVNGAGPVQGGTLGAGQVIPASATIALTGVNTSGWNTALWEIYDYPPGWTAPSGWSTAATGVVYYNGTSVSPNPPSWTAPSVAGWGKWGIRLTVNNNTDPTGAINYPRMQDTSMALSMYSAHGLRDGLAGEQGQFATILPNGQWTQDYKANVRTFEAEIAAVGSPSQNTVALTNAIVNDNVAVAAGVSSLQFNGYTTSAILGGMNISPAPVPGVPFDVQFVGTAGAPVTIVNASAGSSAGNQILTGTSQSICLPFGGQPSARFIRTLIGGTSYYVLQSTGAHRSREFNVLDYGFDPTGTNANDTAMASLHAVISAFVTSAATSAGQTAIVFFPYGTYNFANAWPAFPGGVKFKGAYAYGYSSYEPMGQGCFIVFTGVANSFITAAAYQTYEDLAIMATTPLYNSALGPSQSVNIAGVSSGTGGVIKIQTSVAHGYVTGDQINIFGVPGFTNTPPSLINSDPTTPFTITVVDSTHFSLNGTTYSSLTGSYTPVSGSVTGTSGTASPLELTVTAHGCTEGQLVYVSGVGGTTAANGQWRVHVVDANHVQLYVNYYTGSTGNSAWTSGGTLAYGGTACSNSHIPLAGLYLTQAGSICHIHRCSFGGFKYDILVAGGELAWIDQCNFNLGFEGLGFVNDKILTNNSTHSGYNIAIGDFLGSVADGANVISIDRCQFDSSLKAIYHHDGIQHNITRCNFENPIMATISGGNNVTYQYCENDGTSIFGNGIWPSGTDTLYDCIELVSDPGGSSGCYNLCIKDNEASCAGGGALVHGISASVFGITTNNNQFTSPGNMLQGSAAYLSGTVSPPVGNNIIGSGGLSDGLFGGPNRIADAATNYTTIGHWYTPTAFLDVLAFGSAATRVPMLRLRNPSAAAQIYHNRDLTLDAGGFYAGSTQEWDQLISGNTGTCGGRSVKSPGWVFMAGGASGATVGTVDVPLTNGCGVIEAVIQCDQETNPANSSSFRIRQRFTITSGSFAFVTPIDELEVVDGIGGLTIPSLTNTGSSGAFVISASITSHASLNTAWAATLTCTFTAYA
jgi:hypothetical protein